MTDEYDSKQVRIHIDWTDKLLTFGACGGNLKIERINPLTVKGMELLMTARVKVERYSSGYQNIKWYGNLTAEEFNKHLKSILDVMLLSYHSGMTLTNTDYAWIPDWRSKNV